MNIIKQIFLYIAALIVSLAPQNSYTEGLVGQPVSFLPHRATTERDQIVSRMLFRGLFTYDKEGNLVEDLADSYDISKDGLSYTIYLKKGQFWSNGEEITADDLLYTAFNTPQLSEIATDRIDKYTIRYTLPNKFAPFLNLLTVGVIHASYSNSELDPVSSGPYRVIRIKKEGPIVKEVILQKLNSVYNIGKLSFRYYESEEQLFTAFKLGEIKGFVAAGDYEWKNLNKYTYNKKGVYHALLFNIRNPKLNKVETRRLLQQITPVAEIANNRGIIAKGPLSENQYFKKELEYNLYNPAIKDRPNLELTITLPDLKEHREVSEVIKNSWEQAGIKVHLNYVDPSLIDEQILQSRNFEVLLYGQEISRDPDRYILWHSTKAFYPGLNLSGVENLRLDRSLEEGRNELNPVERAKHYNIFQDVMHENVPAVFLYHPKLNFYLSKEYKITEVPGFYYNKDRLIDIRNWKIQ